MNKSVQSNRVLIKEREKKLLEHFHCVIYIYAKLQFICHRLIVKSAFLEVSFLKNLRHIKHTIAHKKDLPSYAKAQISR